MGPDLVPFRILYPCYQHGLVGDSFVFEGPSIKSMAVTPGDALFDFTNQTPPLALWFAKFEAVWFQRNWSRKKAVNIPEMLPKTCDRPLYRGICYARFALASAFPRRTRTSIPTD